MADLGRVSIVPQGSYSSSKNYEKLDFVSYDNGGYLALKDTNVTPNNDMINWMLVCTGFSGTTLDTTVIDTNGIVGEPGSSTTIQVILDKITSILVQGIPNNASDMKAVDTSGLIGESGSTSTVQALLDAVTDSIIESAADLKAIDTNGIVGAPGELLNVQQLLDTIQKNASGLKAKDTCGIIGDQGSDTTAQLLLDKIADKIVTQLVTNESLQTTLSGYILKSVMSSIQLNSSNNIPTSALVFAMNTLIANLQSAVTNLNSNLSGSVTAIVGTNTDSSLTKRGIGICDLQLSITIPTGLAPWVEHKIATVSFLPKNNKIKNITLFNTKTGNSIKGMLRINVLGDVSLYFTDVMPTDGVFLQESVTYIEK